MGWTKALQKQLENKVLGEVPKGYSNAREIAEKIEKLDDCIQERVEVGLLKDYFVSLAVD